jgi:hypothetical protein
MTENGALIQRVRKLIDQIKFLNYDFSVREEHGGVHLRGEYNEADVYDDKVVLQITRPWKITPAMTDSEIVQTIFKCCMTSMEHRTREHFTYMGARIFGPHFDVNDLVKLCKDGRENAGGRT